MSGTLEKNALDSLALMLRDVFVPLIGNPRNQQMWPEMVTMSIINNVHGFFSSLQITLGQTKALRVSLCRGIRKSWRVRPSHRSRETRSTPAATLLVSCDAGPTVADNTLSAMTSPVAVEPVDAPQMKKGRFLRSVKTEVDESDDLDEGGGAPMQFIDDLLAKLAINEAVALNNLNKWDDDLMQKLRENPSWGRKIQSWKESGLDPTDVAGILKEYPSLSRRYSTEWNAWKIYAAQYLRGIVDVYATPPTNLFRDASKSKNKAPVTVLYMLKTVKRPMSPTKVP
ncbi:hypothetical protein GQ600_22100 [Phytophthora cactorum]|nr:hypothetical protein GQ600_22100 [Phytophthora cactorum]